MSTPAGGSGEPNKEQDDAVTGGKKQLKLNEKTRASLLRPLNDLPAAAADLSGEDTAEGSGLLPRERKPLECGWSVCCSLPWTMRACVRALTQMHMGSYVLEGSTQPRGRTRAGPGCISQNPQCVCAYGTLERGLRPRELSLSLPLDRWRH